MRMTIVLLTMALVFSGSANAQAVKCAHAASQGERLVCSVKQLRSLDQNIHGHYMLALGAAEPPDYARLKSGQKRFVAARRACRSVACLQNVLKQRRYELNHVIYQ